MFQLYRNLLYMWPTYVRAQSGSPHCYKLLVIVVYVYVYKGFTRYECLKPKCFKAKRDGSIHIIKVKNWQILQWLTIGQSFPYQDFTLRATYIVDVWVNTCNLSKFYWLNFLVCPIHQVSPSTFLHYMVDWYSVIKARLSKYSILETSLM